MSAVWLASSAVAAERSPEPAAIPGLSRIPGPLLGAAGGPSGNADLLPGVLVVSELHCTACHSPDGTGVDDPALAPLGAPDLRQSVRLATPAWLERFIADPPAARQGSRMPRMLAHLPPQERSAAAGRLAAFLRRASASDRPPSAPRHSDPAGGRALYERLGCIACHPADPRDAGGSRPSAETGPTGLISLAGLDGRFSLGGLTEFLLDPLKPRPGGRMPRFHLSPEEAADIAGYLIGFDPETPTPADAAEPTPDDDARIAEGHRLFHELRCIACHDDPAPAGWVPPPDRQPPVPLLSALDPASATGCLASVPPGPAPPAGLPQFVLSADDASLLRRVLPRLGAAALGPADRLDVRLAALNCLACHSRNGTGGVPSRIASHFVGDPSLGDEGRFPPDLSAAGAKLRPDWITAVLAGERRARPYLKARMPSFGERHGKELAALFAAADRSARETGPPWDPGAHDPDMTTGGLLLGTTGGMGCINCHGWKDRRGLAMDAVRLDEMPERLEASWFRRALIDPPAVRPGTLMPSFWPDGRSTLPAVLGGDTDRQIASLWRFLSDSREPPPGYPDSGSLPFEIVPKDAVVVQRGFMNPGGTHGIAVGSPQGVHFIFDADRCLPIAAWRGRFIDGYGVWFSRRDPTAEPLEDERFPFPAAPQFTVAGRSGETPAFRGYRLEGTERTPIFLSQLGPLKIEDRIAAAPERTGLDRSIRVLNTGDEPVEITLSPDHPEADRTGSEPPGPRRPPPDGPRRIRIPAGDETTLRFSYRW